jgi:glyoxylase-like metal-dependent hydrolase (beta-lactamase superfamily II)
MPKDTTRHSHADYVYGVASFAAKRHAAAQVQPNATDTRAQRRANMAAFRDARLAATRRAEMIAAFRAAKAEVTVQPLQAHYMAAPLPSRDVPVANTKPVTKCPTRRR